MHSTDIISNDTCKGEHWRVGWNCNLNYKKLQNCLEYTSQALADTLKCIFKIFSKNVSHFSCGVYWIFSPLKNLATMASYVGFANLPNQVHRKSVKKGFEFTLMVVGEW